MHDFLRARGVRAQALGLAVSVLFLGGVVWWVLNQQPPQLPDEPGEIAAFAAAVALYASNTALRAERWHRLVLREGGRPSRADTYALTVVGYAGNNVLPARAGDLLRVFLLAPRGGGSKRGIAGTLLAERLLDVGVLALLLAVVAYGLLDEAEIPVAEALGVLALAALALAAVAVLAALVLHRRGALDRVVDFLRPVAAATLRLRGSYGLAVLAMTIAIWIQEACVWLAAGAAAGLEMNMIEAVYVVSIASLASMIPSGPGYAGTQDAAAIVAAKAIGATNRGAVGYLIVVRFVLLVPITLAGLALMAVRYGGLGRLRDARAEAPA